MNITIFELMLQGSAAQKSGAILVPLEVIMHTGWYFDRSQPRVVAYGTPCSVKTCSAGFEWAWGLHPREAFLEPICVDLLRAQRGFSWYLCQCSSRL